MTATHIPCPKKWRQHTSPDGRTRREQISPAESRPMSRNRRCPTDRPRSNRSLNSNNSSPQTIRNPTQSRSVWPCHPICNASTRRNRNNPEIRTLTLALSMLAHVFLCTLNNIYCVVFHTIVFAGCTATKGQAHTYFPLGTGRRPSPGNIYLDRR